MDQQCIAFQTVRTPSHFNKPRYLHPRRSKTQTHWRKDYRFLLLMIYFEYTYSKKSFLILLSKYIYINVRNISNDPPFWPLPSRSSLTHLNKRNYHNFKFIYNNNNSMKHNWFKPYILDERYSIKGKLLSQINPIATLYEGYDKEKFEKVTIKIIDHNFIFKNFLRQQRKKMKEKDQSLNHIMKVCKNDYICQLRHSVTNDSQSFEVMDFVSSQSLEDQLCQKGYFQQFQSLIIFEQLLSAMLAISEESLIFRFLTCSNIRFINGRYKIGNFPPVSNISTSKVSEKFRAPELRFDEPYNQKVDIWSLGVILFLMIDRTCPYPQKYHSLEFFLENDGWNVNYCSKNTLNLIRKMLEPESSERIRLFDVMNEIQLIKESLIQSYSLPQKLLSVKKQNYLSEILAQQKQQKLAFMQYKSTIFRSAFTKEINEEELIVEVPYQQYSQMYLNAIRSQFLFNNLLKKGQILQQLSTLEEIQVIYLIASRIYVDMIQLRQQIAKEMKEANPCIKLLISMRQLIKPLFQRISKFFNEISAKLTQKQSEKLQIIKRRYMIISSFIMRQKDEKNKFFQGNQDLDFTKQEQIKTTREILLANNLYRSLYEGKCEERIIMNYDILNSISIKELGGESFEAYLQTKYLIAGN